MAQMGLQLGISLRRDVLLPKRARLGDVRAHVAGLDVGGLEAALTQDASLEVLALVFDDLPQAFEDVLRHLTMALAVANAKLEQAEIDCFNALFAERHNGASLGRLAFGDDVLSSASQRFVGLIVALIGVELLAEQAQAPLVALAHDIAQAVRQVGEAYIMADGHTDLDELEMLTAFLQPIEAILEAAERAPSTSLTGELPVVSGEVSALVAMSSDLLARFEALLPDHVAAASEPTP